MTRLIRKSLAALALFTVELVFIWAIFLTCIMVFFFLSREILEGEALHIDVRAFAWADSLGSPAFTKFMVVVTFFASRYFITAISLVLIFYFLFVRRHRWYSLKVPVIALGSISLNLILKFFFNRPRPVVPHLVESSGLSFPSGHAMISASFYGLLFYLVWKHVHHPVLRIFLLTSLVAIILLIGFSRVYLHVHYATDVMAGYAAGLLWVIIAIFSLQKLEQYSQRKLRPMVEAS
jgi:membrane-associated phospholipid phosphatase